jgi:hypothetical protein
MVVSTLLEICQYFDIAPKDFFDEGIVYPAKIGEINRILHLLDEENLSNILQIAIRLSVMQKNG